MLSSSNDCRTDGGCASSAVNDDWGLLDIVHLPKAKPMWRLIRRLRWLGRDRIGENANAGFAWMREAVAKTMKAYD